nr:GntR family transcriptional regulator [Methylobrevis albus]
MDIEQAVIEAILGGRMRPGTRLGESDLAELFDVSRTRVREAMMRLETRGIVQVLPRRGWFVVEPSADEARAAFHARRVIETGLLHMVSAMPASALAGLRRHVEIERAAIAGGDIGSSACLLGDFHIHLAEVCGNPLLTEILRDLTARTVLVSMLYQSRDDAAASNDDHVAILDALEAQDFPRAAALMAEHIDHVEAGLDLTLQPDRLAGLRELFITDAAGPAGAPPHGATDVAAALRPHPPAATPPGAILSQQPKDD